jgi:hypothetical protein
MMTKWTTFAVAIVSGCGGASGGGAPRHDAGPDGSAFDAGTPPDAGGAGDAGGGLCEEPWDPPWIGGPCDGPAACPYEAATCLTARQGFPCGTCSRPCDLYCPDLEGAPTTFCVGGEDLGLDPGAGHCVSRCDPARFGGDGCRAGYACVVLPRFGEPATSMGACLPDDLAPEPSDCLSRLEALGLDFEPTVVADDHPEGRPDITCVVEDAVRLHGPVHGVTFRYGAGGDEGPILAACDLALAIERTALLLADRGAVDFEHLGTYNCRLIAGSDEISMHGYALAIDLSAFTLDDGTRVSVFGDWEDGVADPVTFGGQWLKDVSRSLFEEGVYNIILTPEYNAAHDDHFHCDRTPGASFLGAEAGPAGEPFDP